MKPQDVASKLFWGFAIFLLCAVVAEFAVMAWVALANGGEAIVVYVPFATLAGDYPELCRYVAEICASQRVSVDPLGERLRAWAASFGVRFMDPLPAMRLLEHKGERLYFGTDAHWTPRGHRAVAKIIAEYINDNAL